MVEILLVAAICGTDVYDLPRAYVHAVEVNHVHTDTETPRNTLDQYIFRNFDPDETYGSRFPVAEWRMIRECRRPCTDAEWEQILKDTLGDRDPRFAILPKREDCTVFFQNEHSPMWCESIGMYRLSIPGEGFVFAKHYWESWTNVDVEFEERFDGFQQKRIPLQWDRTWHPQKN